MAASEDLYNSIPDPGLDKISTRRGFFDGDQWPLDVIVDHSEGAETMLELRVDADYGGDVDNTAMTAYLDPLQAVQVGERLAASGRAALAELAAAVKP